MNEFCERYLKNIAKVQSLSKPVLSPDMTQEHILQRIHENAQLTHDLRIENDQILDALIFSRVPEMLSPAEAEDLTQLANHLFSYQRSADVGIAYRIHQLLYNYAHFHKNRNLMIRELYYLGLTLHYMNLKIEKPEINLYTDLIGEYFSKGAAYISQYEEIDDEETRGYIIRCMGNRKFGLTESNLSVKTASGKSKSGFAKYEAVFQETMAVISNPKYREMNPNLPWEQFEYAMHADRTTFLAVLRELDDPEIASAVLESAEFVYQYQARAAKEKDKIVSERNRYIYAAARYHAGRISIEELVEELYNVCKEAKPDDYSASGITLNINMPLYLHHYAHLLPKEEQKQIMPRVHSLLDQSLIYLTGLPQNDYANMLSRAVSQLLRVRVFDDPSFRNEILSYVLACHAPTYVHSKMVAHLAKLFIERMLDTRPELLIGILCTESVEEVLARREEIIEHAFLCGLYHDLGKCQMLHEVSIYGRRLLDEEYRFIQYHPLLGSTLLEVFDHMEDVSAVSLHHHRFYDEKGGYLSSCPHCQKAVKIFVDVVTVCDAIDAATDNVGRSYANAKTLSQLVSELRMGSGIRYSPDVVRLFDDMDFFHIIENALVKERHAIYCQIYTQV